MYCGRILRGVIFLVPALLLTLPYGLLSYFMHFAPSAVWTYWVPLGLPISTIVDFAVRVIATYDAFNVAKRLETSNA